MERKESAKQGSSVRINVYGCDTKGAGVVNTYHCGDCPSLSKEPDEVIEVPKECIRDGTDEKYISRVSKKFERIIHSIGCQTKMPPKIA